MKTKIPSPHKPKSSIPHCPYEIPISTIYNPSCNDDIPVVSIYNPYLNQNTRPPEDKPNFTEAKPSFKRLCLEKLKEQFHKNHRQKLEFYAALWFLLTLVVTGAIIVILHKSKSCSILLIHNIFIVIFKKIKENIFESVIRNTSTLCLFSNQRYPLLKPQAHHGLANMTLIIIIDYRVSRQS